MLCERSMVPILLRPERNRSYLPRRRLRLRRRGVTLVEILIVMAVLMVLSAIVAPLLVQAQRRSHDAVDISNLRQLGIASALYQEAFGRPALRTTELVNSGHIPTGLCLSPTDGTLKGVANEIHLVAVSPQERAVETLAEYKNSYIGVGDIGLDNEGYKSIILPFENPGNFVGLSYSKPIPATVIGFEGSYFRLLADGSIRRISHRSVSSVVNGRLEHGYTLYQLFADHPDQWLKNRIFG